MIPEPRSSVPGPPWCCDSIKTRPGRTAWYTVTPAGAWDCSCVIAVLTFWLTIALTSFALSAGRPDMRRLVTKSAAKVASTAKSASETRTGTCQPRDRAPPGWRRDHHDGGADRGTGPALARSRAARCPRTAHPGPAHRSSSPPYITSGQTRRPLHELTPHREEEEKHRQNRQNHTSHHDRYADVIDPRRWSTPCTRPTEDPT